MITRIEARSYRCLRYVSQPLSGFHVFVGPNASGKTTFLDVVAFLGDLVGQGLDAAVERRTPTFHDLTWMRAGGSIELALELEIPESLRPEVQRPDSKPFSIVRYEVGLELDNDTNQVAIAAERAMLLVDSESVERQVELFPDVPAAPPTILLDKSSKRYRTILNKTPKGNDKFYSETYMKEGSGWIPTFKLGPRRSALASLPEDESKFPVATWLKDWLADGVRSIMLRSSRLRAASPPGGGRSLSSDGGNLPWVVFDLEGRSPDHLRRWVQHLRAALPDLQAVRTVERPEDRHRYLMLKYDSGLEIPSWMASDGTLRLLALTIPAYLPDLSGAFLVEEPENGIHPRAVETLFQSLSSIYGAQVLVATHSPVVLGTVTVDDVLCFAKAADGATDIVSGAAHPALREWKGETDLSVLFAAGVLS